MQDTGIKFVERTGVDLGQLGRVKMFRNITLGLKADGPVTIYLGAQRDNLQDPVRWKKRVLDPRKKPYVSAKVSGRYLAYRIESSLTVNWILTHILAETADVGRY